MRFTRFFTLITLTVLIISCSSDDQPADPIESSRFLKTFSSTDPGFAFAQRNFQYEGDLLTQYDYNEVSDNFIYDGSGRLISIIGRSQTRDYEYNESNELVNVSVRNTSNDFPVSSTTVVYGDNQITFTTSRPTNNLDNVFVHYLDNHGRIIKIIGDDGQASFKIKEYVYDEKGNIIKEILRDHETLEDRENNYSYHLDMINPFYIAYKGPNRFNYHFSNLNGIDIITLYGTTPNVIARDDYEYMSDETNYPIELVASNENGSYVWLFEYY